MATLGDALRALKGQNELGLQAPRLDPERLARERVERQAVTGVITRWMSRHWDFADDAFILGVPGVLTGDVKTWETWLELASMADLQKACSLMESSGT